MSCIIIIYEHEYLKKYECFCLLMLSLNYSKTREEQLSLIKLYLNKSIYNVTRINIQKLSLDNCVGHRINTRYQVFLLTIEFN